jgi:nucleoside diphosphate kinase
MDIEKTRGYGVAISDLEGNWDDAFKSKLKKTSQKIIFEQMTLVQKFKVMYWYFKEKNRSAGLDLSDIMAKGMTNEPFVMQQLEYIAMFSALVKVLSVEEALKIMYKVMEATSVEAFSKSSPEQEAIEAYGDPFEFFRKYFRPLPQVCANAGCLDMSLTENSANSFQYDIHWCVWLELARKMDVPEACIPNCYADDHAYPDYFKQYGIKYSRKGTIANGAACCDLRFERS